MTKLLSLVYPNGRTHELTHAQDVKPGEEFDLYGHRWTVVGRLGRGGRYRDSIATATSVSLSAVVKIDAATYRNEDRR